MKVIRRAVGVAVSMPMRAEHAAERVSAMAGMAHVSAAVTHVSAAVTSMSASLGSGFSSQRHREEQRGKKKGSVKRYTDGEMNRPSPQISVHMAPRCGAVRLQASLR